MGTGFGNGVDDATAFIGGAVLEFGCQGLVALYGHRDLVHIVLPPKGLRK
jgi:hypothetical protein